MKMTDEERNNALHFEAENKLVPNEREEQKMMSDASMNE